MNETNIKHLEWKGKDFIHIHYPESTHMIYDSEDVGGNKTQFFKDFRSYLLTGKVGE